MKIKISSIFKNIGISNNYIIADENNSKGKLNVKIPLPILDKGCWVIDHVITTPIINHILLKKDINA